ncbi:MAG TPA: hypothetical protein DCS82_07425 [Rhodospirillaceae bacterium]|nr:hypothetical protein [Rhodospirillaceae bacterium]HAT35529.1 hypothetical protein [Rhodospirillaceae bacterium]
MPTRSNDDLDQVVFERLQENPVFSALGEQVIRGLVESAKVETFPPDAILIQQGEEGDFAFLILEGTVSVELELPSGTAEIAVVEAGGIVGEMSVFSNSVRSATVRATDEITSARLERAVIRDFVEEHPDAALGIISELGNRLQEINRPLASLTHAAEALQKDEFKPELLESLKSEAGRFKHFAYVFEGMANEITAKMRLRQEMQMAQGIQEAFLPSAFASLPHPERYDIHAEMIAAKHVGGDFYDYFAIGEDRLGIVIGDVSGKGVPAALFMAASRTVVKTTALLELPPAECLARVNATIAEENEEMMFVTLFYGVADLKTGRFRYCNAGHNAGFVLDGTETPHMLPPTGAAIGMSEKMEYEEAEVTITPGQTLFLYTDGVTEAVDGDNNQFGEDRLGKLLISYSKLPPDELVRLIQQQVEEYATGLDRFDDTTCLAFTFHSVD